ncbi:MAG TPA: hypothetical protein VIJ39_03940 [Solirubrobacteraceae bacterium]
MQTERDAEIVRWIGCLGAAGAEHVMHEFMMSRSTAYQRLNSLTHDGLLKHHAVLYGRPGMYTATLAGLRWRGIAHLGVFNISPGGFEHAWQVAQTTIELGAAMLDWELMSERELRSMESEYGKLIASAQVGQLASRAKLHRPDIVLSCTGGLVIPIEVELSTKSASRLKAICRGWARARHVHTVYYLAAPGPRRAVERAVEATKSADRIRVLGLEDIPQLAEEQYAAEDQLRGPRSMGPESHADEYQDELDYKA